MTIREALAAGTNALNAAGIPNSRLDASLLLAEVLKINRSSLLAEDSHPLTEESFVTFNGFIKRRLDGECAAYILGRKEFYGLEFLVNHSVLVPRPDTETLVQAALAGIGNREWGVGSKEQQTESAYRALDLCTGSGAIAITLKHEMPQLEIWAADISAEALETAKKNADRLLPQGSIHFYHGDLFDALPPRSLFNIIVSNPPYIPSAEIADLNPEVRMEPLFALNGGADGLDIITRIISRAPEFLCSGGALLLEADPRQMPRIQCLLEQAGFSDIQTHNDLSGAERVISANYFSLRNSRESL